MTVNLDLALKIVNQLRLILIDKSPSNKKQLLHRVSSHADMVMGCGYECTVGPKARLVVTCGK